MIVKHGEKGARLKIINTNVYTAEDLLKKAQKLAWKFSTDKKADVYIFDHKKDRKGVDPSLVYWTPQELYAEEGLEGIAEVVKDAQGVDLII
jgi:hypothetical protein